MSGYKRYETCMTTTSSELHRQTSDKGNQVIKEKDFTQAAVPDISWAGEKDQDWYAPMLSSPIHQR